MILLSFLYIDTIQTEHLCIRRCKFHMNNMNWQVMSAVMKVNLVFFSAAQDLVGWAVIFLDCNAFGFTSFILWVRSLADCLASLMAVIQQKPCSLPQVQITRPQNYKGHFCCSMTNHGKAKNISTQSLWWVWLNDIPGLKVQLQMFRPTALIFDLYHNSSVLINQFTV